MPDFCAMQYLNGYRIKSRLSAPPASTPVKNATVGIAPVENLRENFTSGHPRPFSNICNDVLYIVSR